MAKARGRSRGGRLARGATSAGPSTSSGGPSISSGGGGGYSGPSAAGVAALNAGGYNVSQGNVGGVTSFTSNTAPTAKTVVQTPKPSNLNAQAVGNYQAARNQYAVTSTKPAVDRANIAQSQYFKAVTSGGIPIATALSKPQTTQSYLLKGKEVPREQMPSYKLTKQFFSERGYDFVNTPDEIPNSAFKAEKQAAARSQAKTPGVMGDLRQKANTYPKTSAEDAAKMQAIRNQFNVPYSPTLQAEKRGDFFSSTISTTDQAKSQDFFASPKTGVMSKSPVGFFSGLESKASAPKIQPGLQSKIKYNLPPRKPDPVGEFFSGFAKEAENTGRFFATMPQGLYAEFSSGFKRDSQGNYASQKIIDANTKELKTTAEKAGGLAFFATTIAAPIPGLKAARAAGSAVKGAGAKAIQKVTDPADFFLPKTKSATKTSDPMSFFAQPKSLPTTKTQIDLGKGIGFFPGGKSGAASTKKKPPHGGNNDFFGSSKETNTKGGTLIQITKEQATQTKQATKARADYVKLGSAQIIKVKTKPKPTQAQTITEKFFADQAKMAKKRQRAAYTHNPMSFFGTTPKQATKQTTDPAIRPMFKQKPRLGSRTRATPAFFPAFFPTTKQATKQTTSRPPPTSSGFGTWPGAFFGGGVASGGRSGLPYGRKRNTAWNVDPNKVLGFLPGPEYQTGGSDVFARLDARTRAARKSNKALDFFGGSAKRTANRKSNKGKNKALSFFG